MKIALQMYTVRDLCKTGADLLRALRQVGKLGYDGVEFAGYAGLGAQEIKDVLAETGLEAVAAHESVDRLESSLDEVLSYSKDIGCDKVVCAYAPIGSREDLRRLKKSLTAASARAAELGITVLYHNHTHEFRPLDGVRPIDEIKRFCPLELDTYWAFASKVDVCAYLKENAGRIGLIHLKDGGLDSVPCAVGEGKNDIAGIVGTAAKLGYEWLIVENDRPVPDGFSDAARSIAYLRSHYPVLAVR